MVAQSPEAILYKLSKQVAKALVTARPIWLNLPAFRQV